MVTHGRVVTRRACRPREQSHITTHYDITQYVVKPIRRPIGRGTRLYPSRWRSRYGRGFLALVRDMRPGGADVWDVLRAAMANAVQERKFREDAGGACGLGRGWGGVWSMILPGRYVSAAMLRIPADPTHERRTGPLRGVEPPIPFGDHRAREPLPHGSEVRLEGRCDRGKLSTHIVPQVRIRASSSWSLGTPNVRPLAGASGTWRRR
jgi:hypothetical protein